jgi:hypothetical protein
MAGGPRDGRGRVDPGPAALDPRRRAGRPATGPGDRRPGDRRPGDRRPARLSEAAPAERRRAGSGAVGRSPPSGSKRDARSPGPGARSVAAGPGPRTVDPAGGDRHPRPAHVRRRGRHRGRSAGRVRWDPPASGVVRQAEPGSRSPSGPGGDRRSGAGHPAAGRARVARRSAGQGRDGRRAGAHRGRAGSACPAGTLSLDASRRRSAGSRLDVTPRAAIRHRSAGTSSWSAAVDPA